MCGCSIGVDFGNRTRTREFGIKSRLYVDVPTAVQYFSYKNLGARIEEVI